MYGVWDFVTHLRVTTQMKRLDPTSTLCLHRDELSCDLLEETAAHR